MPFFQNSRNVQINNSQFNTTINNVTNNDFVLTILWPHVAAGAIFDSAERHAAGKCHPGTRKKMIERIISWALDPDTTAFLLWLYGSAGAGKSALAHTICELLKQEHPETFAASFFFSSGHPDRGNALKLFTTLSYQLAIQFPSFRSQINDALSHDPSLPTKYMEIQFLSLIIQPLLQCQSHISHSLILIIDGLDECADDNAQREIIALMARLIVQHNLPLRVLVASRPEYWIRDAFDTAPLPSITEALCLRDDLDADKDIKAYLIDGFEKIRLENKRVMGSVVAPWPPIETIKHIVREAAGQYVYASTILKFVGKSSRFCIPPKQLEIILSPGPHRALAFSELDRLYATIVSAYPEWETMKRVLQGLLINANTTIIKVILRVGPDELIVVLDALSSLIGIKIPDQPPEDHLFLESIFGSLLAGQEKISFSHRSFREFLEDETRSGAFHVDPHAVRNEIVKAFCEMIHHNIDQKYEVEPHILANIDHFTYHDVLPKITSGCLVKCTIGTVLPHISRLTQSLVSYDPSCLSLDAVLCFKRDTERVQRALLGFRGDREMYTKHIEFAALCDQLYTIADLAQTRAMDVLSLCSEFKVTPTIVYLANYYKSYHLPIRTLSTIIIPGTTDVLLSTITDHRHFLRMSSFHATRSWCLNIMNFNSFCNPGIVKSSRIQTEWIEARIFLAYHNLKCTLSGNDRDHGIRYMLHIRATSYLDDSTYSDICDKEYFQNTDNLSILALMTDQATWSCFLRTPANYSMRDFIIALLCWFNRQLTNPQTLKLLQDYDESLQQNMMATMKLVFEQGFLPYFMEFCSRLLLHVSSAVLDKGYRRSITLRPLPLPQGFREEQGGFVWNDRDFSWDIFHDEVFGKPSNAKMKASQAPLIEPSCWHPHLAAHLLNVLVRCLYDPVDKPDIFARITVPKLENPFRYFVQCLPYAEPTVENLDALRAIVYLYPRLPPTGTWDLPKEFWPLAMEFVQKYDRSLLSSEELELFMLWLQSTDRVDITTYVQH